MSCSDKPQFSQMILIPAFRAAGMACWISCSQAEWPAPFCRPNADDRKKFCMSMMMRADLLGDMVIEVLVVSIVTRGPGAG
jgi:hypothetical protein